MPVLTLFPIARVGSPLQPGGISFSLSWSSPWRQLLRVQECEARGAKINWQLSFTATKEGKKEITRKLQNSEKLGARLCPGFSLYLVVSMFSYSVSLSSLYIWSDFKPVKDDLLDGSKRVKTPMWMFQGRAGLASGHRARQFVLRTR